MARNYEPRPESFAQPGHDPEVQTAVRHYMGGAATGDLLRALGPMDSVPESMERVDDRSGEGSANTVSAPRGPADAAAVDQHLDEPQASGPVATPASRSTSANFRYGAGGTVDPAVDVDRSNVAGRLRGERADQRRAEAAARSQHGPWYTSTRTCCACDAEDGKQQPESNSVLPDAYK
jgi:hypothetical protein